MVPRRPWRGPRRAQQALRASEQPLCKRKKPRFPSGGGAEGYLRHSAEGFSSSAPNQFGSRRTGSACQKRKTPPRGHSHAGSLRTSQLGSTGGLELGGQEGPSFPAEMSAF